MQLAHPQRRTPRKSSKSLRVPGKGGEAVLTCSLLSPAATTFALRLPGSFFRFLGKCYRPSFLRWPKKLLKQMQQQLDCWGFCSSQWDTRMPTLYGRRKDQHCQWGHCFAHWCTSYKSENLGMLPTLPLSNLDYLNCLGFSKHIKK